MSVDLDKCQGHGRCAVFAPQIFELGDDDKTRLLSPEPATDEQREQSRLAAAACPEQAISIDVKTEPGGQ